jgi:CRP-like cAMP-binding protein
MSEELTKADLYGLLHFFHPLSVSLREDLDNTLIRQIFKKGGYLLKSGSVCDRIHFITKGLIHCYNGYRGYATHRKEGQGIDYFMMEGDIAISKESFYSRTPSRQSILAMEETSTLSLSFVDLEGLYKRHPEFNINGRKLTEYYHCQSNLKSDLLRLKKPMERYNIIKERKPALLERVPGKYLAIFLGVGESTLSRIKAQAGKTPKPYRPGSRRRKKK